MFHVLVVFVCSDVIKILKSKLFILGSCFLDILDKKPINLYVNLYIV